MSADINVHDAKTHFSRLLERAHAGEEIVLAKAGKPYARLMLLAAASEDATLVSFDLAFKCLGCALIW